MHNPLERIVVRNGVYQIVPFSDFKNDFVASTLTQFIESQANDFDCIVELGSGFGRNLFMLDEALARANRRIPLHACELTDNGRRVTQELQQLGPEIPLQIHPFDYYDPDLSFLEPGSRVLFLTVHSIEQIPSLPHSVIERMLARTSDCSCFHFEPVGWQTNQELVLKRGKSNRSESGIAGTLAHGTRSFFKSYARTKQKPFGFPSIHLEHNDIGQAHRVAENAAAWSARAGYNTNLIEMLISMEKDHRISISDTRYDVFGINPFNPSTVIQWNRQG